MSDPSQTYKGHRILGVAVGSGPPYQSRGRIETDFAPPGWGCWIEETTPEGEYKTVDEAREAGRQRAQDFVDLNPHLLPIPKEDQDES